MAIWVSAIEVLFFAVLEFVLARQRLYCLPPAYNCGIFLKKKKEKKTLCDHYLNIFLENIVEQKIFKRAAPNHSTTINTLYND
jgi:hypothetical protein